MVVFEDLRKTEDMPGEFPVSVALPFPVTASFPVLCAVLVTTKDH